MTPSFRLLVVEDDSGHATLFERSLRRAGVRNELLVFSDGEEVLAFLRTEHDPARDVMLLDLRMPRMDGVAVLRELRRDPLLTDLPVIVTSTTLDPGEEQACHALGCGGFLLKPIRHDTFTEALRRLGISPLLDSPGSQELSESS